MKRASGVWMLGAVLLVSAACGKKEPKAFAVAREWQKLSEAAREDLCTKLGKDRAVLITALDKWSTDAGPAISAKAGELATEIAKLDKGNFGKLQKMVESWNRDDQPCDKLKAKFSTDELLKFAEIKTRVDGYSKAADEAYAARGKTHGLIVTKLSP
jgi:hypothetical protein